MGGDYGVCDGREEEGKMSEVASSQLSKDVAELASILRSQQQISAEEAELLFAIAAENAELKADLKAMKQCARRSR